MMNQYGKMDATSVSDTFDTSIRFSIRRRYGIEQIFLKNKIKISIYHWYSRTRCRYIGTRCDTLHLFTNITYIKHLQTFTHLSSSFHATEQQNRYDPQTLFLIFCTLFLVFTSTFTHPSSAFCVFGLLTSAFFNLSSHLIKECVSSHTY